MKRIIDSDEMNATEATQLLMEIKILSHFQRHPNIASLQEVVPFGEDQIYLIFRLAKCDLKHRICLGQPIPEDQIRNTMQQFLTGLKVHCRPRPNRLLPRFPWPRRSTRRAWCTVTSN